MKEVNKNKQLMINMIASMVSCLVGLGISFVLSPIIIADWGVEGNGFIEMANQFTNFVAIAALALNSMAGRFITVKIYQNDEKGANQYFNSVMYANLVIVAILSIPCFLATYYLEHLVNISPELVSDVKLLFAITFLNFMVNILSTTFSTATFAANRLDLTALRTIESQVLRAVILIAAFYFLPVRIYYVSLGTLIATIYLLISYIRYTKKLLPQIEISPKHFRFKKIIEILSAGIWNTVMRTGQTLTNGLDSLITNLWIGRTEMGMVATSKTIVAAVNMLYETIAAVFTPSLTISFAKEKKDELVSDLTSAMKMTGFFANIPLAYISAFGLSFYTLWLRRAQDTTTPEMIKIIYILTLLTMFGTIVGGTISPLFNVYTVVNKLKWNSLVTLFMGMLSAGIVFLSLYLMGDANSEAYGVYVVVGVSTLLGIIKNMTFTPMYAAHCLGISKKTFYPTILRYLFVSTGMIFIFIGIEQLFTVETWPMLFISILICGMIGSALNFFFLFGKKEQMILRDTVLRFLRKDM